MNLELFYFDECPYCQKVLKTIDEHNLESKIVFSNVKKNPEKKDFHFKTTRRNTVPCLYVNGQPMFESKLISEWLINNRDKILR